MSNATNPFSILKSATLLVACCLAGSHAFAATTCHTGVGDSDAPLCVGEDGLDQLLPIAVVPKFDACYKLYSECTSQPNGACGWTASDALDDCIDNPDKLEEAKRVYGEKMHQRSTNQEQEEEPHP